ncbi:unnamed protein product, partial [Rotaria sp. Silwood2]
MKIKQHQDLIERDHAILALRARCQNNGQVGVRWYDQAQQEWFVHYL